MRFEWGPLQAGMRLVLECFDGDQQVGSADLGIKDVDDDVPGLYVDFISVEPVARGAAGVSVELVLTAHERWPEATLFGGPVSQDDGPGPRFRLRCWEAGIPIHEPSAPHVCSCRDRIRTEIGKRLRDCAVRGEITADELEGKLALLGLPT